MRLESLRRYLLRRVDGIIAFVVPFVITRSLKQGLHGLWVQGEGTLPPSGVILAPNHHSWWDGYLAVQAVQAQGRRFKLVMGETQLSRFPFFRRHGVIGTKQVREALRALQAGEVLILFPEGALQAPARVEQLQEGLAYLARKAHVPIVPLAIRVSVRGAQHPEAFLAFGEIIMPEEEVLERYQKEINSLLERLDTTIRMGDPEAAPTGFTAWTRGIKSTHERAAGLEWLWKG